ncbi:thermonuclease family protein [Pelagibacterium sp. H642]|uniref:thermonuclease family protein n=1 Tax=Pelagibacterium sp. H642 TaxID=1881069 RepID=UPI0028152B76|nr:thermonuclease family protein [Pelagibacterium sp. H642]WMT91910.1 thermonuclease family protein [Pelagibacterium sp. H642]
MIAIVLLGASSISASAQPILDMCAPNQRNTPDKTCIVDGDTLWLNGENIRLEGFDTPEPQTNICGGDQEKALAAQASARLRELLNGNEWTIERDGMDRNGRTLATIRIGGRDVGEWLVEERLARWWQDGEEWWCAD